jgi:hypothetical protein
VGRRTVTLLAAPLGGVQPGRPIGWDQLPADARAWADQQADQGNEMLTAVDGDHRAELQGNYDVFVVELADRQRQDDVRSAQPPDSGETATAFAVRLLDPDIAPRAFARDDAGADRANSRWHGAGAALREIGLRPGAEVDLHDLVAVVSGRHARTGAPALPAPGAVFDLVFTAPNSVSMLWSQVAADARAEIEEAMFTSAATMIELLVQPPSLAGPARSAPVGLAALVLHAVGTRSADGAIPPILHVHSCLFGVSADNRIRPVDEAALSDEDTQRVADAGAQADLAHRLVTLGWQVRNTAGRGRHNFEVAGVPPDLLDDADFWKNVGCGG